MGGSILQGIKFRTLASGALGVLALLDSIFMLQEGPLMAFKRHLRVETQ